MKTRVQSAGSVLVTAVSFAVLLVTSTTCGSSSSSQPSPMPPGFYGQWIGPSSQGRTIAFTVAGANQVTEITIGYDFNGCSGTKTFSGLNVDIATPAQGANSGFAFGSGPPGGADNTQVLGTFTSSTTATGSMVFGAYAGCGSSAGTWSATRR